MIMTIIWGYRKNIGNSDAHIYFTKHKETGSHDWLPVFLYHSNCAWFCIACSMRCGPMPMYLCVVLALLCWRSCCTNRKHLLFCRDRRLRSVFAIGWKSKPELLEQQKIGNVLFSSKFPILAGAQGLELFRIQITQCYCLWLPLFLCVSETFIYCF